VYVPRADGRPAWLAVDPTLNQYPADATHLRIVRGGLDRQTAVLPLIGKVKLTVLDLQMDPKYSPVLVGAAGQNQPPQPFTISLPNRTGGRTCWSRPAP
jgi:hypothetical protein